MKIGIVTYHNANNYGAVLQAYALNNYIDKNIADCDIVDYRSDFFYKRYHYFIECKSLRKIITSLLNFPIRAMIIKRFDRFRNESFKTGKEVYNDNSIKNADTEYDKFVFGSDQIWNYSLNNCDYNYLGDFVSDSSKLNAYAASFGFSNICDIDDNIKETYSSYLNRFKHVAVREEQGTVLVNYLTGKRAEVVCDPVFLLNKDEWDDMAVGKTKRGRYIFLYHLQGRDTDLRRYAKYLSKKTGLPVIEFQAWVKPRPICFKPVFGGSPEDFLGWIKDAEYVITDSFHCTAFSIIFMKKFWSKIAINKDEKATRVGNLLYKLNLHERIIPEDLCKWDYDDIIDYKSVEDKKIEMISSSKEYLRNILVTENKNT